MVKLLRFSSIRGKLLGVLLTAIILSLIIGFSIFVAESYRSGINILNQRLESSVITQADALSTSVWHYDFNTLNAIMNAFARDPDFQSATVRDTTGDVIAALGRSPEDDASALIATHPIVYSTPTGSEEVGLLEVSFRLDRLRADIRARMISDGLVILVLTAVMVAVIVVATNRMISIPLNRLMRSINDKRLNNLRQPVDWDSDDELGHLVRSYNEMQVSQTETEDRLQKTNVALEQEIADRESAENALRQSHKMQALGQLTGGVAHDFNNLLAVIYSSAELLGDKLEESDELLGNIMRATERGADLTSRLLTFSRRQALDPKTIDLNAHVEAMTEVLRRSLGENVSITNLADENLWFCKCDPGQLENAILNFALNARDAMPDGGVLAIKTFNQTFDEAYAAASSEVIPGDYTALAVTDNGCGMSPHSVERAFEPFYTTKGLGEGTGLGLSMAFGFAKQSLGHLTIDSEEGHGTTVTLYLPRSFDQPNVEITNHVVEVNNDQRGLILIVEDDLDVRELTCAMVRSLGYTVLESASGESALAELHRNPGVNLLLTDVMLVGKLMGPQVADLAQEKIPGLKVIFMSGYADEAIIDRGKLNKGVLLRKPFRKNALAKALREALGFK